MHVSSHLPRRTRLKRRVGRWRKAGKSLFRDRIFCGSGSQENSKNSKKQFKQKDARNLFNFSNFEGQSTLMTTNLRSTDGPAITMEDCMSEPAVGSGMETVDEFKLSDNDDDVLESAVVSGSGAKDKFRCKFEGACLSGLALTSALDDCGCIQDSC